MRNIRNYLSKYGVYLIDNRFTPYFLVFKTLFNWFLLKNKTDYPKHQLENKLIVSLTSYPARYQTLHLTLYCLLTQSVKPDEIILWIAEKDIDKLPRKVCLLEKYGLTINRTKDIKSYKKIIPTINKYGFNINIVTADDDIYYWHTWLESLLKEYNPNSKNIIAHRAHKVNLTKEGYIASYNNWVKDKNTSDKTISSKLFFTGCGGVLFPNNSLPNQTIEYNLFMKICPTADDIWLNWMVRKKQWNILKIKSKKIYSWPTSQKHSLVKINVNEGNNDKQITNIVEEFGNVYINNN